MGADKRAILFLWGRVAEAPADGVDPANWQHLVRIFLTAIAELHTEHDIRLFERKWLAQGQRDVALAAVHRAIKKAFSSYQLFRADSHEFITREVATRQ